MTSIFEGKPGNHPTKTTGRHEWVPGIQPWKGKSSEPNWSMTSGFQPLISRVPAINVVYKVTIGVLIWNFSQVPAPNQPTNINKWLFPKQNIRWHLANAIMASVSNPAQVMFGSSFFLTIGAWIDPLDLRKMKQTIWRMTGCGYYSIWISGQHHIHPWSLT